MSRPRQQATSERATSSRAEDLDGFYVWHEQQGDKRLEEGQPDAALYHYRRSLDLSARNLRLIYKIVCSGLSFPKSEEFIYLAEQALAKAIQDVGQVRDVNYMWSAISILRKRIMYARRSIGWTSWSVQPNSVCRGVFSSTIPRCRIVLLTCVWKRPELTDVVLEYYGEMAREVREYVDLRIVAVGSEGEVSKGLCEKHGCEYHECDNEPLNRKWEFGLRKARLLDPDGVVIAGSDDLISKTLFVEYSSLLRHGVLCAGVSDAYFMDCNSGELIYWRGYGGKARDKGMPYRIGETLGMGRLLSKRLLDVIDVPLWGNEWLNKSLDRQMTLNLERLDMLPVRYCDAVPIGTENNFWYQGHIAFQMSELKGVVVDIKYDANITPIDTYVRSAEAVERVPYPWALLEAQFPKATIDKLKRLSVLS